MAPTPSWWRRLGAALAALVVAVLAFGPGLDGVLCGDESGMAAAAAELSPTAAAAPDHSTAGHADDERGACVHGHCHHAGSYAPAPTAASAAPVPLRDRHGLIRARVATSDPKFGLLRPPRG